MRKLFFMVVALAMTHLAISQTASPELVSSSGDSFNNTSYRLDWSIGECITATHSSGDLQVTQGFHQGKYDITTQVDNIVAGSGISINAYPNPTSDLISLKVKSSKVESMQYTITDLSGKVLQQGKVLSTLQTLNFTNYSVGTYLITVSQNNQLVKSFQIIKK